MKTLLRAVLPAPFIRSLQQIKDQVVVHMQPRRRFDFSNLVRDADYNRQAIMTHSTALDTWEACEASITRAFGSGSIYAGANAGDRRFLYHLVLHKKPKKILETGTHVGASTAAMALGLSHNGDGRLTTVDIRDVNADDAAWRDLALPGRPRDILHVLKCVEQVCFVTDSSTVFMNTTQEKFDLIFLDGNHDGDFVYSEVDAALRCLAPGGWVVLHDVYPNGQPLGPDPSVIYGPDAALRRIGRENRDSVRVEPLSPLPWPARDALGHTSLALLLRKN